MKRWVLSLNLAIIFLNVRKINQLDRLHKLCPKTFFCLTLEFEWNAYAVVSNAGLSRVMFLFSLICKVCTVSSQCFSQVLNIQKICFITIMAFCLYLFFKIILALFHSIMPQKTTFGYLNSSVKTTL